MTHRRTGSLCSFVAMMLAGCQSCQEPVAAVPLRQAPGQVSDLVLGRDGGETGWWPSLAFDRRNQPHLSFCDPRQGDLVYATRRDGTWQQEIAVAQGAVGKYTSLAVDSGGRVAIAYYDQEREVFCCAWQRDNKAWKTEEIAWGREVGMAAELRFDRRDEPHVFYYVPTGKLIHAHKPKGGPWQKSVLAEAVGSFSIRISPVLRPEGAWISFVDWGFRDTRLILARPHQGSMVSETVADRRAPGWRSQLLFRNHKPLILFSRFKHELRLAEPMATGQEKGWQKTLLLQGVGNFAAAGSSEGGIVVAYQDVHTRELGKTTLKYLRRRGGQYERYTIDEDGPVGKYISLALDRRGRPLVVYFAYAIAGLRVYDETS